MHNPDNTGHGHVFPRPDGVKARCGGPAFCKVCASDLATQRAGYGPQPDGSPPAPPPPRAMRPTEHLRFLVRSHDNGDGTSIRERVLQQQWAPVYGGQCEWRDVPLVAE